MSEISEIMNFQLTKKKIELNSLEFGFANNPDFILLFDKQRLQQVYLNFLSNAVKFIRGSGRIEVILFHVPSNTGINRNYHR